MGTLLTHGIDATRDGIAAYHSVAIRALSDIGAGHEECSCTAAERFIPVGFDAHLKSAQWLSSLLKAHRVEGRVRSQLIPGVPHLEANARGRRGHFRLALRAR